MRYAAVPAFLLLSFSGILSAADPQLLNMVPPGAKVIAGVNVDQARMSPFGQFLLSTLPVDAHLQEMAAATGFDPRNDVHEILVASSGPGDNVSNLIMARGNFDIPRILSQLPAGVATTQTYAGAQLVVMGSNHGGAFAFLDPTTAIAGDAATVRAALDRRSQANSIDPALALRITELSASQDAWSVSTLPLSNFAHGGNPQAKSILSGDLLAKIQQTSGGVKFGPQIQVSGVAVTGDPKDAAALGDVVKFLAMMVQSNAPPEAAPAVALVKNLNVATDGSLLKLDISIEEAQLEALIRTGLAQSPALAR